MFEQVGQYSYDAEFVFIRFNCVLVQWWKSSRRLSAPVMYFGMNEYATKRNLVTNHLLIMLLVVCLIFVYFVLYCMYYSVDKHPRIVFSVKMLNCPNAFFL